MNGFRVVVLACGLLTIESYGATIHGPTDAPKPPSPAKDVVPPERTKNAPEPDFRKVRWGASIAEVKASEPGWPESETACSLRALESITVEDCVVFW